MGIESSERFQRTWRTYIEASLLLETHLEADLRSATGMPLAEFNMLLLLSEAPNCRMRVGLLAERMVFSPSRLTYQVKSMEQRGLVLRQTSTNDRRIHEVVLTAVGLEKFREAGRHHSATVQALFDGIVTDEDLEVLESVFSRLRRRVAPERGQVGAAGLASDVPTE